MLHISRNTKLGRIMALGLIASALAPVAPAAYASSGPTPDVVLSRSDNPPATSSDVRSGPTPDVILSRTDNPPATPEIVSVSDSGGFDWGSAGIGAAMAVGL